MAWRYSCVQTCQRTHPNHIAFRTNQALIHLSKAVPQRARINAAQSAPRSGHLGLPTGAAAPPVTMHVKNRRRRRCAASPLTSQGSAGSRRSRSAHRASSAGGDGCCRIVSWPRRGIALGRSNSLQPHSWCSRHLSALTRLVLPRGAPPSTIDFLFFSIHFIQASMPFFCCSGVELFIAFSKSVVDAMYRTEP